MTHNIYLSFVVGMAYMYTHLKTLPITLAALPLTPAARSPAAVWGSFIALSVSVLVQPSKVLFFWCYLTTVSCMHAQLCAAARQQLYLPATSPHFGAALMHFPALGLCCQLSGPGLHVVLIGSGNGSSSRGRGYPLV